MARKRCEIFKIKQFDEAYDDEIKARIAGIKPQVLVTISDGKPDDYDNYRGEYGIEDTRRALLEARRQGIHPYCITIDTEAKSYLPRMYGPAGFSVIDKVAQLPLKVSDIYRRLTT